MSIVRSITVAAAGAGVVLGGFAVAPTASAATGDTVVVNCLGKGVVKPKQIVLACADDQIFVYKITWKSWKANEAKGSGTLVWNTCLPKTCAAGIVQKYQVNVKLGRVASGPGIDAFSGMTLSFPNGGPAAAETATYTLDNPIH